MALQMDQPLAGDRPDLGRLDRMQVILAGFERGDTIVGRAKVDIDEFVPPGTVDPERMFDGVEPLSPIPVQYFDDAGGGVDAQLVAGAQ